MSDPYTPLLDGLAPEVREQILHDLLTAGIRPDDPLVAVLKTIRAHDASLLSVPQAIQTAHAEHAAAVKKYSDGLLSAASATRDSVAHTEQDYAEIKAAYQLLLQQSANLEHYAQRLRFKTVGVVLLIGFFLGCIVTTLLK